MLVWCHTVARRDILLPDSENTGQSKVYCTKLCISIQYCIMLCIFSSTITMTTTTTINTLDWINIQFCVHLDVLKYFQGPPWVQVHILLIRQPKILMLCFVDIFGVLERPSSFLTLNIQWPGECDQGRAKEGHFVTWETRGKRCWWGLSSNQQ